MARTEIRVNFLSDRKRAKGFSRPLQSQGKAAGDEVESERRKFSLLSDDRRGIIDGSRASSFFFRASVGCLWPLAGSTRSCPSISEYSFEWNRHQLAEVKVNMAAISDAKERLHC